MSKLFTTVIIASTSAASFLLGTFTNKESFVENHITTNILNRILPFHNVNAATALVVQPHNQLETFGTPPIAQVKPSLKNEDLQVRLICPLENMICYMCRLFV